MNVCWKVTAKFLGYTRLVWPDFAQASNQSLKMQNYQLKCNLITRSFLICTSVRPRCELYVFLSTFVWACTDFSHGLRKCRGVKEVALLEYVGRLIFLFLSLTQTVYFCRNKICLQCFFRGSALVLPFPFDLIHVFSDWTVHWSVEKGKRTRAGARTTHPHTRSRNVIDFLVSEEFEPCKVN